MWTAAPFAAVAVLQTNKCCQRRDVTEDDIHKVSFSPRGIYSFSGPKANVDDCSLGRVSSVQWEWALEE